MKDGNELSQEPETVLALISNALQYLFSVGTPGRYDRDKNRDEERNNPTSARNEDIQYAGREDYTRAPAIHVAFGKEPAIIKALNIYSRG